MSDGKTGCQLTLVVFIFEPQKWFIQLDAIVDYYFYFKGA